MSRMNYSTLNHTTENRKAIVTLNRPEKRNALDDIMISELNDVFNNINRDQNIRIVIITGAESSFCAGMDLDYLQKYSQKEHTENLEDARQFMKLLLTINTLKKPVIAMVNGPALGGGCGIVAACDFIFASKEKAKLGVPEVRLGFLPAIILMYLVKRMGEGAAREFVLRGEILDAIHAKEKGLVTEVVDDKLLKDTVYEFADQFASTTSPSSISLTKELFSRFNELDFKEALEYAANLNALIRKTEDFKKGIESFLNKEKLQW